MNIYLRNPIAWSKSKLSDMLFMNAWNEVSVLLAFRIFLPSVLVVKPGTPLVAKFVQTD